MAARVYEGLFLFDSNRYARDSAGVTDQIRSTVEKLGGEMLAGRLWTEQKLAYQIRGHRKGTYWLAYFRLDSDKQVDLNRQFQLNNTILRNLVLKIDDRLVDTLVQHAAGTGVREKPPQPKDSPGTTDTAEATDETKTAEPAEKVVADAKN